MLGAWKRYLKYSVGEYCSTSEEVIDRAIQIIDQLDGDYHEDITFRMRDWATKKKMEKEKEKLK